MIAGQMSVAGSEACTMKQVQHTLDIFSLSGFTKPNNHTHMKRSHSSGYQVNPEFPNQAFSAFT